MTSKSRSKPKPKPNTAPYGTIRKGQKSKLARKIKKATKKRATKKK